MTTLKSIIPELIYIIGVVAITFGLWTFMTWEIALIFGGAALILIANYLNEIMKVEASE